MSRSVMLPESCGNPVHRETPYTISNTGTSIILTVATNPPVVFTLQPNLEWTGPGRVIIAGEKIVGYGPPHEVQVSSQVATGEKWMYNGVEVPSQFYPGAVFGGYNYKTVNSTQTVRDPITEPIKAPCTFGTITLMGPATDVASVLQSFGLQEIPPGLHMVGDYVGTNGLTIKFHSEKLATTICGDAEWADKYAVMPTGKDIHIRFQNGKSPYEMILRPDGTLAPASSGSVTVNAREMIGMKDGEGVFKPLPPKTCALSALSPQN